MSWAKTRWPMWLGCLGAWHPTEGRRPATVGAGVDSAVRGGGGRGVETETVELGLSMHRGDLYRLVLSWQSRPQSNHWPEPPTWQITRTRRQQKDRLRKRPSARCQSEA